ncbi:MAPEG family protein [Acinetobacter variabilis]|uniref:MAPEG family protein n=1 Tax=Acinetobacter TaxID=469 RepID=UPI00054CCB2F|nr:MULTISPECIES: MAPEG family protein [Acinetobacter]MCU4365342.1 MAPEG family protein [Acinetobacter variabilis]MCU4375253.1 MAPEG family protein [Acinetobacter variabilis]QKW81427.1 MAPEG family protein [Acinetobacter sp. FDAARGOS_724]QXR19602.1 MAPEG family protein [Acinetobacter variabilis]UXI51659.1 MAPEG family protein [Acinetobacter variabilis]
MHSISGVIYLILAACLLPYVFTLIAKKSAGFRAKDNQNPRAFLEKSTGLASRANAAQQNSFESLPLFIASILMAEYMVVTQSLVMTFGIAYLVFRVIYGICYLANWSTLRSIVWLLSLLCPITLLLLIIKIS